MWYQSTPTRCQADAFINALTDFNILLQDVPFSNYLSSLRNRLLPIQFAIFTIHS